MMKAGKDQGRKKEYRFFTKRVALLAAITLVFTTLGSDIRAFGETYGNVGTDPQEIATSGSVAQAITAEKTEKLKTVSFSLYNKRPVTFKDTVNENQTVTTTENKSTEVGYTVNVYENVSSIGNTGSPSATKDGSLTIANNGASETANVSFLDKNIYLTAGEPLLVVVTFNNTTDTENKLVYYNKASGSGKYWEKYSSSDAGWSDKVGSVIGVDTDPASEDEIAEKVNSVGLTADNTYLKAGETAALTVSYDPSNVLRQVKIETPSNNEVISVSPTETSSTATVTALKTGTATVKGYIGGSSTKKESGEISFTVYEPVYTEGETTYIYDGEEKKPKVGFNIGGETPVDAENVTYPEDSSSAGSKTVTFTGAAGKMTGELTYTIGQYDISGNSANQDNENIEYSDAKFENNSIKSIKIKDKNSTPLTLTEGTDYTVSSTISGSATENGKTKVTYTVTVTGQGNYTGTAVFTGVGDEDSKTDISKVFNASIDDSELVYTGKSLAVAVKDRLTFSSKTGSAGNTVALRDGDYTISYFDENDNRVDEPVNAGFYTVQINGTGNSYTGTIETTINVTPMDMEDAISRGVIRISFDGDPDEGKLDLSESTAVYYINGEHKIPSGLGGGVGPVINSVILSSTSTDLKEEYYDIEYSNNKSSGKTGYLTITGYGNFRRSAVYEFKIRNDFNTDLQITLANLETSGTKIVKPDESGLIKNAATYTYNGSERKPAVRTVKLGNNTLNSVTDYSVEYSEDVTSAGGYGKKTEHYIIIKGKDNGEYKDKEVKIYYTISPIKISNNNASLIVTTNGELSYTGAEHKSLSEFSKFELKVDGISEPFVINDPGTTGNNDTNENFYINTESFSNNINAGTASVKAVGKGNLDGDVSGNFKINPLDINDRSVAITLDKAADSYPYTGSEIKPVVTLSINNVDLPETDFSVSAAAENILPGSNAGKIVISGDNGKSKNLTGEVTRSFTITNKNLDIENYTYTVEGYSCEKDGDELVTAYEGKYTGAQVRPGSTGNITVLDGTKRLTLNTDYTLDYRDNTGVGDSAYLLVRGAGGYGGEVKIRFTISPLSLGDGSKTIKKPEDNISSSYNVATGDVTVTSYFGVTNLYPATKYTAGYGPSLSSIGIKLGGENGTHLNAGTDFEIVPYSSEGGSGDLSLASPYLKTARVEGKGNYTGFFYIQYTVGDNISGGEFTLSATNENGITGPTNGYYKVPYGVSPNEELLLKYGNKELLKTDSENEKASYTVTYIDKDGNEIAVENLASLPAGTNVTVRANAIAENGKYYGTKELKYTVVPATASISFKDGETEINTNGSTVIERTYRGEAFTTDILSSGETSLTIGTDYFIDGGNEQVSIGTNAGVEKTVTISFSENYSNSDIKVTYKINPKNISGATISAIEDQTYEGSAVEPRPTVTVGGKTLTLNKDYTLSYENNNAVGAAKVTVTAKGNYTGTAEAEFSITKFNISNGALIIGDIGDVRYVGEPEKQKPEIDLTLNGRPLSKAEYDSLTIEYVKFEKPGMATIRVSAKSDSDFSGTVTKNYKVIGNISDTDLYEITGNVEKYTYEKTDGVFDLQPKPDLDIKEKDKDGKETSTVMTDKFSIDYSALETLPGSRSIIIEGKGDYYTGTRKISASVYGKLNDAEISAPDYLVYKGEGYYTTESSISAGVVFNGRTLPKDIYEMTVTQNDGMTVTVEATAKDGASYYKGESENSGDSSTKPVNIPIYYDLTNATITLDTTEYEYDKTEHTPTVNVICAGKKVVNGTDCEIIYKDNINAGTATVEINPIEGKSIGETRQAYFTIKQVGSDTFSLSEDPANKNYEYVGSRIEPSFSVISGGKTLTKDTDYTVSYGENLNVGNGSVRVTGINNYNGEKAVSFNIKQKSIGGGGEQPENEITVLSETKKVQYSKKHNLPDFSVVYSPDGYSQYRLVEGTDYEASLKEDMEGSDGSIGDNYAKIDASGAKNFTGSFIVKYTVTPANISSYTCETGALTREYDGNETTLKDIKSNIKVTDPDGGELIEGTDYSVSFDGSTENSHGVTAEGDYPIVISGTGNYDGSISLTYSITKRSIENENNITATYTRALEYTGSEVTINDLKLIDKGLSPSKKLVLGTDYTIDYKYDNTSAGQKTAYLTGIGSYTGSRKIEYTIGEDINNLSGELTTKSTFNYTGHAQAPTGVRLSGADGKPLAVINTNTPNLTLETRDGTFTMSYENKDSVNAGTYKITVAASGTGKYFGEKVLTYEIKPVYVSQSDITVSMDRSVKKDSSGNYSFEYTGSEITPPVVVTYKPSVGSPITLAEGTDYYVEYGSTGRNNIDVGGPIPIKVTTYKTGNFSNELSVSGPVFYITGIETGAGNIELYDGDTYEYTGSEIRPYIYRIFDGLGNEIYDGEYEIVSETYENNIYPGTATLTLVLGGKGNYSGTLTKEFRIVAGLTPSNISDIPDQFFTGAKIEPPVTVRIGDIVLTEGVDYTVSYSSNNEYNSSGIATVTLLSTGQYYNYLEIDEPLEKTFRIVKDTSALTVRIADTYTYTGRDIIPLEGEESVIFKPDGTSVSYTVDKYLRKNESSGSYAEMTTPDLKNVGYIRAELSVDVNGSTLPMTVYYEIIKRAISSTDIKSLENTVYTGNENTPATYLTYNGIVLTKGTDYEASYLNNTYPGTATVRITGLNNFTGTVNKYFKITVPDVTGLKSTGDTSSVTLSWNKNNRISGYLIYSADGRTIYADVKGNTYKKTNLTAGSDYSFGVVPYVEVNGKRTYGNMATLESSTVVSVPSITPGTVSSGQSGAAVTFSTVNGINYKVFRATSKNGTYSHIATVPSSMKNYVDTKAVSGRTYYYRVQAVKILSDGTVVKSELSSPVAVTAK